MSRRHSCFPSCIPMNVVHLTMHTGFTGRNQFYLVENLEFDNVLSSPAEEALLEAMQVGWRDLVITFGFGWDIYHPYIDYEHTTEASFVFLFWFRDLKYLGLQHTGSSIHQICIIWQSQGQTLVVSIKCKIYYLWKPKCISFNVTTQ